MSKQFARALALSLVMILSLSVTGVSFAAPSSAPIDHMEVLASNIFAEKSEITVMASVEEGTAMPTTLSFYIDKTAPIKSVGTFDPKDASKVSEVEYEKTDFDEVYSLVNVKLTDQRAVKMVYEGPKLVAEDSSHVVFGMSYKLAASVRSLTMGAIVPEGFTGAGSGVSMLGLSVNNESIYGNQALNLSAESDNNVAIALMPAATNNGGEQPVENQQQVDNSLLGKFKALGPTMYLILGIGLLTLILLVVLIVLLAKSRKRPVYDYYDESDSAPGEDDESDSEDFDADDSEISNYDNDSLSSYK